MHIESADRQMILIRQMAVGSSRLQYMVDKNVNAAIQSIQPNTDVIDRALSDTHVDNIHSG